MPRRRESRLSMASLVFAALVLCGPWQATFNPLGIGRSSSQVPRRDGRCDGQPQPRNRGVDPEFLGGGSDGEGKAIRRVFLRVFPELPEGVVKVLLTKDYNEKLNEDGQEFQELRRAGRSAGWHRMVVLVLEPELKDVSKWSTSLPRCLHDRMVDASSVDWTQKEKELRSNRDVQEGIPAWLKRVADEPTGQVDRNVLLCGRTGAGKSLLGMALTGNKTAFKTSSRTSSETKNITSYQSLEHKLAVFDTEGFSGTEITNEDEFLRQSERLFDNVLDLWTTVPEGMHMIVYVMEWKRVDCWDALIAEYIQKYVFVGNSANVCLVMTKSPEDYLGMTPDDQRQVLMDEAKTNEHFHCIFDLVRQNPRRVIFVDNEDPTSRKCSRDEEEQDRRMNSNELGLAPLRKLLLEACNTAKPAKEEVARRLNELHEEIQADEMKQQLPEMLAEAKQKAEKAEKARDEAKRKLEESQRKYDRERQKQKGEFQKQAKEEKKSRGGCFAGHCEVVVKGQGKTRMSAVKCGDLVRGDKGWCRVVAWLHRCPITPLNMRRISTTAGSAVVTANHLLISKEGASIPASEVKIGDELASINGGPCVVTSIGEESTAGYYAPLTETGDIVVSGLLCSCYVHSSAFPFRLDHAGISVLSAPLRWALSWLPSGLLAQLDRLVTEQAECTGILSRT